MISIRIKAKPSFFSRFALAIGLYLLFGLALNAPALAIEPVEVLRVGTPGDYAPYASMNPQTGQYEGYDVDLIRAFAKHMRQPVTFVPTTWGKLMPDLKAGRFHIAIGGINSTPDRAAAALQTRAYSVTWKTMLTRCGNLEQARTSPLLNRPQTRLLVNQGGTNERYVRHYLPLAKRQIVLGNTQTLKTLLAPLSPPNLVMITDAEEALTQQKAHPSLCTTAEPLPHSEAQKVFLVHPDRTALRDAYDAWHDNYESSEDFNIDRSRWFPWFENACLDKGPAESACK